MNRNLLYALIAFCSITAAAGPVAAAELGNPTAPDRTDDAKMPATADFSNGPEGGGAKLLGNDHVPSSAEFSNGPAGGATQDPAPRHLPTASEFSNGPTGISQQ